MAHLRGDSTVGGKPIVTLDVMNTFVEQIQGVGLKAKINKYEEDKLSSFSNADLLIKDKEQNGFYQINNGSNSDGKYNYGQLANLSNLNARFQLYAPHNESGSSALYFRTGWDNDIKSWERITTQNMLQSGLNTKFDKTGGNINGSINATSSILSNSKIGIIDSNGVRGMTQQFNGSTVLFNASGVNNFEFSHPIISNRDLYVGDYSSGAGYSTKAVNLYSVWHEGNLNPNNYVSRTAELLTASTNLNTVKNTGYYRCSSPTNAPNKITGWAYIEVINHSDTYALQKIYSYDGNYTYSRTLNNGTWTTWTPLGGGLSFTKDITSGNWSSSNGMYEMTVTHNLGSENITSVIVTDASKISMFTGFQIISSTVIKVFSATNSSGKIVINAII